MEFFIGKDRARDLFDLKSGNYSKEERETEIKSVLITYVLPFLNDVSSEKGIITAIKKYKDLRYYIDGELGDYLKKIIKF